MNLHQNRGTWISSIGYFALLFPDAIFTTKQNYVRGRCFWSFAAKQFYFRVLIVESLCFWNLMGLFSVSFYLVFVVSIFSFSFFVVDLREFIFNHTLRERSFVSSKIEYLNTEEVAISSIAFPCRWNISKLIKCFFFFFFRFNYRKILKSAPLSIADCCDMCNKNVFNRTKFESLL